MVFQSSNTHKKTFKWKTIALCLIICTVAVLIFNLYLLYLQGQTFRNSATRRTVILPLHQSDSSPTAKAPKLWVLTKKKSKAKRTETDVGNYIVSQYRKIFAKYGLQKNENFHTVLEELKLPEVSPEVLESFSEDDIWKLAASWVSPREIFPSSVNQDLAIVLRKMHDGELVRVDGGLGGTQLKLHLTLSFGQKAAFKPMTYPRGRVFKQNPIEGADRHNAELFAFHLSRLMDLRRVPLAIGRHLLLDSEVSPIADPALLKTVFKEENNTCLYGICYYCKPSRSFCAKGESLEGAMLLWLPGKFQLRLLKHPWARSYRDNQLAMWETEKDFCSLVKAHPTYKSVNRLLDLTEVSVMDFLIGNADRHHYEVFASHPESAVLQMDNGKGLGNPDKDELTILAPLYQCCQIRTRFYDRLKLFVGGGMGQAMKEITKVDPVYPLVTDKHLSALDRRLLKILIMVEWCVKSKGRESVFV